MHDSNKHKHKKKKNSITAGVECAKALNHPCATASAASIMTRPSHTTSCPTTIIFILSIATIITTVIGLESREFSDVLGGNNVFIDEFELHCEYDCDPLTLTVSNTGDALCYTSINIDIFFAYNDIPSCKQIDLERDLSGASIATTMATAMGIQNENQVVADALLQGATRATQTTFRTHIGAHKTFYFNDVGINNVLRNMWDVI